MEKAVRTFCPFANVRFFLGRAETLDADMPHDIADIRHRLGLWEKAAEPSRPVLCHGDSLYKNIIEGEDGKIWLVDWEYAGRCVHPLYDLAWLGGSGFTNDAQDEALLAAYAGRPPDAALRRAYKAFKALAFLADASWGLIQHKTAPPITDYKAFAEEYFGYYRSCLF